MHWKAYRILLPPFMLTVILSAIYLPLGQKHYALSIVLLFWAVYYTWVYIEKRK